MYQVILYRIRDQSVRQLTSFGQVWKTMTFKKWKFKKNILVDECDVH